MSKSTRLHTEQERHRRAFEVYYAQGAKRTYERVAAEMGVSVSAVKLWNKSFSWPRRLDERDAQVARGLADRSLHTGMLENERNLKIVRAALLKLAKGIGEGKLKMQMGDLDRLIRLEEHLSGADTAVCRNPTHRIVDEIEAMQDPEQLKQMWMQNILNMGRRWPEVMDVLREAVAEHDRQGAAPPARAGASPEGV